MPQPKKLIEVAMPVKEVSAESVRDKSIRHGHISTLHLWWARRPLPVCRAVVFASLVPDPLDSDCPKAFKDAVKLLLGKQENNIDPYKPYDDIPYTSAIDKMEDNLRNRLLMFIGKFSDEYAHNEKIGKSTAAKNQLSDYSLIKWDNKNNDAIINNARKLIWVSHNAKNGTSAEALLADFDKHYKAIKDAEQKLYNTPNRHITTDDVKKKEEDLQKSIDAFLDRMPKVFDPFAGGGAIPLEAARLGCRSYGNDINPVAHIIQKGSLEFPQKYGKPITYSKEEFIKLYGKTLWNEQPQENKIVNKGEAVAVKIENRLSLDIEFFAKKMLAYAEKQVSYLYPPDEKGNKPIAYYWARVGTCSNPSCRAEVPLLKGFYLANTKTKQVYLKPFIKGKQIHFEIKNGNCSEEGWMARGNLFCPVCGNTTDVKTLKQQFLTNKTSERLLAVIWEGKNSKEYKLPSKKEIDIISKVPLDILRPTEEMPVQYTQALPSCTWGLTRWGDMFTDRQITSLQAIIESLSKIKEDFRSENADYGAALLTYLGIFIDRVAVANTSFGVWHVGRETLERPMGRQAIPMIFDFPESNPFCNSAGSALNQLEWLTRYTESECNFPFPAILQNASSGEKEQFLSKSIAAVVTDPPYYDAIAYADLSDFFYVWMKRTLSDVYPLNFATPQTPKGDECTALKHHHKGDVAKAKKHFENKLLQIFDAIEHQTSDIVSIMFAHQSTEAWTTLCNSILGARMNITGSWANDTEMTGALKTDKAFLSSSVTVSCRPVIRKDYGDYKEVKKAIENKVQMKVNELYHLGFRGADLLTACFGQAVGEFGNYERVEKADGSPVEVSELLRMARDSAFEALVKGYQGDEYTKFYIGWLQLYGFTESDFDDVNRLVKIGLRLETKDLFKENILIKSINKQTLATFGERITKNKKLGEEADSFLVDQVHRAMHLYKGSNRSALLKYIAKVAASPESSFWRVATSLDELLPKGSEDQKQVNGLLANKESLIRESKQAQANISEQSQLFQ